MSREKTDQLLDMIENGTIDRDYVIMACLKYMSEYDVVTMMRINEMDPDEWDEEEED